MRPEETLHVPQERRLHGRTVLVTGATGGIGMTFVAAALARGAAKVYAAVRRTDSAAAFGPAVVCLKLDLADAASIDAAAAAAPDVDLLISNAGRTLMGPFLEQSDADLRDTFEVNMFGPLRLMRALLPALKARRGGIICVTSMAALMPALGAEGYSASKAGMMMLAHGVRTAARDDGVRVCIVYPGFVDTPMAKSFDVKKASPRQIAERSIDGWCAGQTSIFPDLFAEMTRDALLHRMDAVLTEPRDLLVRMVDDFVAHAQAGT